MWFVFGFFHDFFIEIPEKLQEEARSTKHHALQVYITSAPLGQKIDTPVQETLFSDKGIGNGISLLVSVCL